MKTNLLPRRPAFLTLPPRAALAALACSAALAAAPGKAAEDCSLPGAPWRELVSRHFVIDLAGDAVEPARVVEAFEGLRAAVLAALIAEPVEIPGKVRVILLRHERDLADYTGTAQVLGMHWVSRWGEPTILMSADHVKEMPEIVAHELGHHLSSYLFPRQAYWFAEGLAQFVESVARADDGGRRWAGGDPSSGWVAGSVKLPPMASLVRGPQAGFSFTDPYVASWILYRFLWNERGRQLSRYQQHLMDGAAPDEAWRESFPEWAVEGGKINLLDNDLARYQRTGKGIRWEVKGGPIDAAFTIRPAPLGDIHLSLLRFRLLQSNALIRAQVERQELEEAEREEPGHPIVAAELARLRGGERLSALRAIAAARPADGRGWYLLGLEATDPAEREEALHRAVKLWPDGSLARAALAELLVSRGRAREGLAFANAAVDLAPWSPTAVASLAQVALALSQCKQALVLQARALEASASKRVGSLDADVAALRAGLAAAKERCAPKAAAP